MISKEGHSLQKAKYKHIPGKILRSLLQGYGLVGAKRVVQLKQSTTHCNEHLHPT